MPTIEPILLASASPHARHALERTERRIGRPSEMLRTMAHSPLILETYLGFSRAFEQARLGPKLLGLLSMTIAQAMGCEYILSVALALGQQEGLSIDELEAARRGQSEDPKISLALQFAMRVVEDHGEVDSVLVCALRDIGYSDEEIVEPIGALCLNLFRNYFNLIVQTEVDLPLACPSEPLRQAAVRQSMRNSGQGERG